MLMFSAEPVAAHLAYFDGRFFADELAKDCERVIHTLLV
jgi:hypothetical protein